MSDRMDVDQEPDINATPWSPDEDLNLIFLVRENLSWDKISAEMMRRSKDCCEERHKLFFKNQQVNLDRIVDEYFQTPAAIAAQSSMASIDSLPWSPGENLKLITQMRAGKTSQQISDQMPGRSVNGCQQRGRYFFDSKPAPLNVNAQESLWYQNLARMATMNIDDDEDEQENTAGEQATEEGNTEVQDDQEHSEEEWNAGDRPSKRRRTGEPESASKRPGLANAQPKEKQLRWPGGRSWRPEDDAKVLDLRRQGSGYSDIQKHFPTRTVLACQQRLTIVLARVVRNTPWTPEEDVALMKKCVGALEWPEICKYLPGRTAKACSERYLELS